MKQIFLLIITCCLSLVSGLHAQDLNIINSNEVTSLLKTLSDDDMEGRATFTPGIEKAADFIADQFEQIGLTKWDDLPGYRQSFDLYRKTSSNAIATVGDTPLDAEDIIAVTGREKLMVTEDSSYDQIELEDGNDFYNTVMNALSADKSSIVWVSESQKQLFGRLKGLSKRPVMNENVSVIFVLHEKTDRFHFEINSTIEKEPLFNVIGILPGKSLKDEYVVFSAHYDHLGIGKPDNRGDSIFNGANDDASGTTAVMMLAKYFKALNNNERTLVFVTFTAEEIGGYGSQYFSRHIDPEKVTAMFNIEMIGTDSKWGKNSGYITGFEKSDFGEILQKNLKGSQFRFEPDPYPKENLFYRSDNATLARLGVPAHTLSTSQMDQDPHYHRQSDEIQTLDLENMTEFIKAIALSSQSIVSGKDTPTRVSQADLR